MARWTKVTVIPQTDEGAHKTIAVNLDLAERIEPFEKYSFIKFPTYGIRVTNSFENLYQFTVSHVD
jgi:hypothetical protein